PAGSPLLARPPEQPEARRWLRLLAFLGAPPRGEHLEFPLRAGDGEELRSAFEARGLEAGAYACVHPGARYPSRRWPAERFAAIADALAARGLTVVLTGSADEAAVVDAVGGRMRARPVVLAGRTTLGALARLLADARLLVCNDTGVSHLAAALRTPSVVVVTGSDPRRWAPLDSRRHRVVHRAVA